MQLQVAQTTQFVSANPHIINSNLQRFSIFSSTDVRRNNAISPIRSSNTCFVYCAPPERFFVGRKLPKVCFCLLYCTWPDINFSKTPNPYLFFGYITEMAFCLLYQTWPSTRSKSTISICNQPGSQAPTLKYNMFRKYSARSSIHYMVMVKTTNDFT